MALIYAIKFVWLRTFILIFALFLVSCPVSYDDVLMLQIYHKMHKQLWQASYGSPISEAYLAALISLETFPSGNWNSKRFEVHIYKKLVRLKKDGKRFGNISSRKLRKYTDAKLKELAHSYGPTQMMGYHCLELDCNISDLQGAYHLQWAVAWMEKKYGKYARKGLWENCFRIHNTGQPNGKTYHAKYVQKGLIRMKFYEKWLARKGQFY